MNEIADGAEAIGSLIAAFGGIAAGFGIVCLGVAPAFAKRIIRAGTYALAGGLVIWFGGGML